MDIDAISGDVVDSAVRIHKKLGPGLLESVYETVLAADLERRGHKVDRQKAVDIEFEGLFFPAAFRIDILVDETLVLEIKSVESFTRAHAKQLLTYLRLTGQPGPMRAAQRSSKGASPGNTGEPASTGGEMSHKRRFMSWHDSAKAFS